MRRVDIASTGARLLLATVLFGGCRQLVGIGDQPEPGRGSTDAGGNPDGRSDDSGMCGGYVFANAACSSCGVDNCCGAASDCMSDAECSALVVCERACALEDGDCLALCELASPTAVALERALATCTSTSCAQSCIAPQWACLQHPAPPRQGEGVTLAYGFADYVSGSPLVGFVVRGCGATDFECETTKAGPATTSAQGTVLLQWPVDLNGYIEVSGPGYPTTLLFSTPIPSANFEVDLPLPSTLALAQLEGSITTPQPGRGTVLAVPHDCTGGAAAGVSFMLAPSDGATQFYFADTLPSASATQTDSTAGFAVGGFFNTSASTALTVSASVVENGLSLPPSVLFARPGGLSIVYVYAAAP
jgi:hypothetical protein